MGVLVVEPHTPKTEAFAYLVLYLLNETDFMFTYFSIC